MNNCANCQFFEPDWEEPQDGFCRNPKSDRFKDYALLNEACDFFQALEAIEVLEIA
ncbi:hypothetical protein LEP1GSC188_1447 [Leptospira weilii serovar Topaz str. LT2116]|uniref:Uncharacterized protein n=1 Tax=Leptospira weilii serovar Topaz str. LT2116 TaxID=1088540 RepID=M3FGR1_9LEPT|nr:hypothetical protein LEP1GSC188_1447 [Leptospira weilii serovar Topaz str. LT2116]